MRLSTSSDFSPRPEEGEKRCLNSELWHACAGLLVSLPAVGTRVVYFPQGHSEQVSASTNKEIDAHIPNYPSLPPQLISQLHNVTMHADVETDEVYAQMTLQPLSLQEQKDVCLLPAELGTLSRQPTNYFCKTLTASDTSTHGGFSVPRRAAEKVFPPLDYTQQPPAQELIARDLHGNEWKFRHIFRGQPKRHLLTTGWSIFVSAKKLLAGDSVIFIWNENNQLFLGIRRANRPQTVLPSSVLSSDSMHIGLLAAAAHAAATNSRFTIFYNPRASPSEFVIPLAKYAKAVYHTRVSVGMRFRMLFETEESSVRRYMGTITGISDLDPVRWSNSHWRSVKVGWDESTAGERQPRVSLWEIEPLTTFPMYPSAFPLRLKRPWPSGLPSYPGFKDGDMNISSALTWLHSDVGAQGIQSLNFQGIGGTPWMQPRLDATVLGLQPDIYRAIAGAALQDTKPLDSSKLPNQTLLPFQQPRNVPGGTSLPRPILQQSHSEPTYPPSFADNLVTSQPQLLAQQLQLHNPFNDQQQQHAQQQQLQQPQLHSQFLDCQQMPKTISGLPQIGRATQPQFSSSQTITSTCQQQTFAESIGNHMTRSSIYHMQSLLGSLSCDEASQLLNLHESNSMFPSSSPLSKQAKVEPQLPSGGAQFTLPRVQDTVTSNLKVTDTSSLLPPFPGRQISEFQGIADPLGNGLFSVDMDSSLIMENGLSNLRNNGYKNESFSLPFATSSYTSPTGTDFTLNSDVTISALDESGMLQSSENVDQVNPPIRTFVKVHKSGSFGKWLDISKVGSYNELRSKLACMFGLEGELEDTQRSGWQLVFVDRENDILPLGDGPWQEFVNNVWYIKIFSPLEVQQVGEEVLGLPKSVSMYRLPSNGNGCDSHLSCEVSINNSDGIASVGSLEY